jgi:hypothetical protein
MSAIAVAVGSAVVGIYGASQASKAAKAQAGAQQASAEALAAQGDRAAQLSYDLGQERLAFERQQYQDMLPIAQQVSEAQLAAQEEQMRQARDYYDYQTGTFRPLEQGLVRQAQEFSTEGYREGLAREAAAAAGRAFGTTQGMTQRAAAARGVNIASGAGMAMANQNMLGLAAQRAGAMTGARQQAEQIGWARQLDAAGLGRGLAGASSGAYSGAVGAGSAGLTSAALPGQNLSSGMAGAANTMLTGTGQSLSAYNSLYGGATTSANAAYGNYMGVLGGLVGMGGNIAAAKFGLG